ncbi:bile acid:sodium symporter family protein [Sediminitomix flava]|uniref:Sodium/bile acid cotransporter 7 n=1 Tax=Sediminitomix flava TaxID=379075 RepID=A0A315ZY92_SEDFL|nr:bile acid:sodium symporter family protein [Sediminitomix flava]PWJ42327.1 sodium/bile acid cotransporter 7 [Sediminitomix flava]
MKVDKFVLLLILMIILAYFIPQLGHILPLEEIGTYGIAGIFFFYGLKLSPSQMKEDLSNWKLHLLIQSTTFIIFPLLVLCFYPFINSEETRLYWLAVFYLAVLPSTVSSSVVMVSIAKGNIPSAIFNASISGLIGMVLTPLWMSPFLQAQGSDLAIRDIFLKLFLQILLPVILGVVLNKFWGKWAIRYKAQLGNFDKAIILIIVYESFCDSFEQGIFEQMETLELLVLAFAIVFLFFLVMQAVKVISNFLGFNRQDQITALFCGSKKSLVHGTVFSNVLFVGMTQAGLFLVPIMLYHAFQLFYISILAEKMGRTEIDN